MDKIAPRSRPFRWLDALILAGSIACAVSFARATDRQYVSMFGGNWTEATSREDSRLPAWLLRLRPALIRVDHMDLAVCSVLGAGLALISYRPRPRIRRSRPGPGHVASAIILVVDLVAIALGAMDQEINPTQPMLGGEPPVLQIYKFWMTFAAQYWWGIAGGWAALALSGGWVRAVDWPDRLGRLVGWGVLASWVLEGVIMTVAFG